MRLIERAISFIAPHICLVCQQEGSILCNNCSFDSLNPLPERCYRCHKLSKDSETCQKCRRYSKVRLLFVLTDYSGIAKDLLQKLKFERAKAAAGKIAELMDENLPYIKPEVIVTSVPTAASRVRVRGYDQSVLIAKAFARRRGLVYAKLLARVGKQRQVGASRQVRLKQLKDVFLSVNPALISKADVLVIDDVLTTGATLETAASELKKAGAKTVNGAVFAASL